jgi:hypothetical protein
MRSTSPGIEADDEDGARLRGALATNLEPSRKTFSASGIHLGYWYSDSPIVVSDAGTPPKDDPQRYQPSTWPGARAPHAWRSPGVSTLDWFGRGFTLVVCGENAPPVAALEREAQRLRVPLEVVRTHQPELCSLYERRLVLVRPDGHVAWRGNELPQDNGRLLGAVRGAGTELASSSRLRS